MDSIVLKMNVRAADVKPNAVRSQGQVPCVLYGNEVENTLLMCDAIELLKVYRRAGESTLVDLDIDGKTVPVLFHSVDLEPVSDDIEHVDFFAVNMNKPVDASVHVTLEGESPAVKTEGGVLVTVQDHVNVHCLPKNLPHDLPIDLSALEEIGSSLTVADLTVPEGVEITDALDAVLVTIHEPRKAVEEEPATEEGAEGEESSEDGEKAEGGNAEASE